jgi:uncharacterized protein YecE (DUF72 family)
MRAPIRIGTSGWEYRHWAGDFYPTGLSRSDADRLRTMVGRRAAG